MDLRKGATQLDSFLGAILSVQILHALFIENPRLGDPDFPMVDKSPGDKVERCYASLTSA
jgi:asparagine synthase (glutamine-hydrolysing)